MNCQPTFRRRRAFTLIEVMVAIFVFSIIMAAIYSTWAAIMKSTQVAQEVAARAQRQRVTLRTIEDSITGIESFQQITPQSENYYSFKVENGDSPELSFTAQLPKIFPRNGKFSNPDLNRDFSLRRLTFSLQSDQDGAKDLVLRQQPVLMDMDQDEQKYPLVLAKNVQKFSVLCWGTNAQTGDLEWADEWDDTNSIPTMLRVSLVTADKTPDGRKTPEVTVTRVISVPSQMMPAILRSGHAGPPGNQPPQIHHP